MRVQNKKLSVRGIWHIFWKGRWRGGCGSVVLSVWWLKGTTGISSQAHAHVDEKHFEIVGSIFSNTVGEFRTEAVFICLNHIHLWKVSCQ